MPRRPRPASRRPPQHDAPQQKNSSKPYAPGGEKSGPPRHKRPQAQLHDLSSDDEPSRSEEEGSLEQESGLESQSGSEDEFDDIDDAEPDAPRVAQWVDEEELDEISADDTDDETPEDDLGEVDDARLEADLHSLSFGALRKAQKTLSLVRADTDSEEDVDSDGSEPDEETFSAPTSWLDKGKAKEDPKRQKKDIPKRKNKHAPVEMSSKRPVSRSRFVVEEKLVPRDPRFMHVTGEFDTKRFHSQYGFLSDMHTDELKTLRDNLKRARKLLANSPRDLREDREAEVERLERAVKRAESSVNKDRREKVELDALSKVAKEEREKQKQGKKAWFMKDADKKALLLRAKYDALAEAGGRGAVRKAIEKKQKKVSQKEKKKRPFVAGQTPGSRGGSVGQGGPLRKRPRSGEEGGARKRPRSA